MDKTMAQRITIGLINYHRLSHKLDVRGIKDPYRFWNWLTDGNSDVTILENSVVGVIPT